ELFAPDPVSDNRLIHMQIKTHEGKVSDWFDITMPLIEKNRSNIFSPYNRLVRIPTSSAIALFQEDRVSRLFKEKMKDDETQADFIDFI
ncbi:DUF5819 family protein, partial [Pseudomonas sp. 2822-15]|uniref:DUF5819 family protein n=1 Tax=Pseudomonas sp. 2822-15 TaxID=1712677 RepID=UPI001C4454F6